MNLKRLIYMASIVLLVIVGVIYIGETYARYQSISSGSGDVEIAKWVVALKDGSAPLENRFDVTFISTSSNNGNTAPNRFAPGTSGEADLIIDLTNTEVAVDYNITVDTRVLKNQTGASNITLTMSDGKGQNIQFGKDVCVPLVDKKKFTDANGILRFHFALTWDNASDDSKNSLDTDIALHYDNLTLPVSIKIKQHMEGTDYEKENRKITSNISYAETTETKQRETQGLNYTFNEQDILSDNPEKGFYSSSTIGLNESGLVLPAGYVDAVVKSKTNNLLYLKVDLSAFSGKMNGTVDKDLTPAAISALEGVLERIKQNNNTIILRFVYDNNATGIIPGKVKVEPEQPTLLRHIEQLTPIFQSYKNTINIIQIGFYGLWGEAYYNTDVSERVADDGDQLAQLGYPEYYQQTVSKLLDATAGTDITIAVRTPKYYTWYRQADKPEITLDSIESDITTSADAAYRVGIFNDAYGGSADDLGTYVNREKETNWLHNQAAHTFFGGEAISASGPRYDGIGDYNTEAYFINEAFKIHTSYINWEWNQDLHAQWAAQNYSGNDKNYQGKKALTYIENHLGYRFVVKEVRTYETVKKTEELPIDITIENVGFANLIKEKKADIVFTNSDGTVAYIAENVGIDARDFLSQTTVKKSISIPLPSELTAGMYKVYFRLSKGEKLNDGRYYGAIRFANDNMWKSDLEANYIAEIKVEN